MRIDHPITRDRKSPPHQQNPNENKEHANKIAKRIKRTRFQIVNPHNVLGPTGPDEPWASKMDHSAGLCLYQISLPLALPKIIEKR